MVRASDWWETLIELVVVYTHFIHVRQMNNNAGIIYGLVSFSLVVCDDFGSIPKTHELKFYKTSNFCSLKFYMEILFFTSNIASGQFLMKIDWFDLSVAPFLIAHNENSSVVTLILCKHAGDFGV